MGARTSEVEATVGPSVGRAAAGVISGFRRDVCAILGCYAASGGKFLETFRHNPSVPTSRFMDSSTLRMGPIGCTKTSVRTYHYSLPNNPEESRSQSSPLTMSLHTAGFLCDTAAWLRDTIKGTPCREMHNLCET